MVDLSKAYDRINTSLLCDKMRETELPGLVIEFIDFMCKNTFVCTSYGGQLSDEWNVRNGVRQGGISSGILFNFYLNEVISDITKLPVGCTLNCNKVNILGYADDLVLVAPTAQALQLMLNALTCKLSTLSLQVNVQKSCNIVFRHSNKKVLTSLTMNNQPLRQVMDTTYLGVVLSDDLSCAKDVERAKLAFFKQFNSIYHKFSFVDKNVLLHLFRLHAMSFYGAETWYINLNKKDLKNISKAIKRMCGRNYYDGNHECLEQVNLPIFKHFLAKKQIQLSFRLFHSRSPCLSNHKYYFRYGSLFSKYIRKLFSDNYQIIDVFDNPMCAITSRIDYVQRNEPRSSGYDPG